MAFNAGAVRGSLELETGDFVSSLRRARKALNRLDKGNKRTVSSFQTFKSATVATVASLGTLTAALGAVAAARGAVGFFTDASNAAARLEQQTRELAVSLSLQGVQGAKAFTQELRSFAVEIQNTTQFSDNLVLQTAQTLTVLGVQQRKLKDATRAVLDYSAATGRDAVESARQFGKTLGGTLGELSEAFPALKNLSTEALKNGEAFDFAQRKLGGFAEAVANTTEGLAAQAVNQFGALQEAIGNALNPVRDAITRGVLSGLQELTANVEENRGALEEFFRGAAQRAVEFGRTLVGVLARLPETFFAVRASLSEIFAGAGRGARELGITIQQTFQGLQSQLILLLEPLQGLPGIGDEITTSLNKAKGALSASKALTEQQRRILAEQATEAEKGAQKLRDQAAEVRKQREEWERTGKAANVFLGVLGGVNTVLDRTERSLAESRKNTEDMVEVAGDAGRSAERVRDMWAAVNQNADGAAGAMRGAKTATDGVSASAARGKGEVDGMANAAGRLKSNLEGAARAGASAGEAASGGGEGGPSFLSDSRRTASSTRLDFSDPFRAASLAQVARERQRATGGNAFIGGSLDRAAAAFTRDVTAKAKASIDRAIADFQSQVLSDLNSAGVTDPQERSRRVQERTREAQRLGIIPKALRAKF